MLLLIPALLAVPSILSTQCAECHSEQKKTSGFSIATVDSVLAGGNKHGRAVIPGHPEQSPLIRLLKGEIHPQMPLGRPMSKEDIASLEDWVRGLPAPSPAAQTEWRWPFEKPVRRDPPASGHPVDAFVLQKATLAPAASQSTLARRLYLDLIGLPPSPGELSTFLNDPAPDAYPKLIDKLLADPRYGERWGRHWLDLARYGETSGLEGDGDIGNAWRYRDWVIQAFNDNLPYDRFVLLQLAGGDEHSKTRNNYQPDPQGLIPTGFLRVAPWDRSNLVAGEVRQNYLSEVASTTASVFLGLTLGCARCHDHKYDPLPQRDYYRFQAFFNATQAGPSLSVPYKDKAFALLAEKKVKDYQARLKDGPEKSELDAFEAELLKKLIAGRAQRAQGKPCTNSDLRLELKLKQQRLFTAAERDRHADLLAAAERTGDPGEQQALDAYEKPLLARLIAAYEKGDPDPAGRFDALAVADVRAEATARYSGASLFTEAEKNRHAELTSQLDIYRRRLGRWRPDVLGVSNVPGPPSGPDIAPTRILTRGDYRQPGDAVEPGFPSTITGHSGPAALETDRYRQFTTRGLRITLARWIASPDNPLTARVMANRIWQHHFGEGIVRTPSDFGRNGARPTHPHLLDWLALRFVGSGWDIKAMHRLILTSETWRQSAGPGDFRPQRRRLEAEVIRDSILYASGRLNPERGGPSVFPHLPDDLADFARYGRTGGLMWEPNESDADARRRSVYIFQRRSLPLPMMAAFDALPFSEPCERRSSTTTPLQALAMMNGALVHDESEHLARRIAAAAGAGRPAQVRSAFQIVLNRSPQPDELDKFASFNGPLDALCRVLLTSNEFLYVE